MAFRLAGLRDSALALPPFEPPSLPSATAAGFLPPCGSSNGEPSSLSPMACSTTRRAVTVKSWAVPARLGLLERLGMAPSSHERNAAQGSAILKLTHYPKGHWTPLFAQQTRLIAHGEGLFELGRVRKGQARMPVPISTSWQRPCSAWARSRG